MAPQLQVICLSTFLIDYTNQIPIKGDNIDHFLAYKLQGASKLSHHTQLVHIECTHQSAHQGQVLNTYSTYKYFFSEPKTLPWGNPLPINCPKCNCIRPWRIHTEKGLKDSQDLLFKCKFKHADAQCTFVRLWFKKPDGLEVVTKDVGRGRWFQQGLALQND